MKKILHMIGILAVTTPVASSVIACGGEQTKQTDLSTIITEKNLQAIMISGTRPTAKDILKGIKNNNPDANCLTTTDFTFKGFASFTNATIIGEGKYKGKISLNYIIGKEKVMPGDGNCAFWSTMLAFLDPVKNNKNEFNKRSSILFGNQQDSTIIFENFNNLPTILKNLNDAKKKYTIFVNLFRTNAIEYFKQNISQDDRNMLPGLFEEFNENNKTAIAKGIIQRVESIEQYFQALATPTIFADAMELKYISEFLNCTIKIYIQEKLFVTYPYNNSKTNDEIWLNYQNNIHYNYYSHNLTE